MPENETCVFCKIAEGIFSCYKVYEDDFVIAFLDINPLTLGHTLVVPKKHVAKITELEDEEVAKLFKAVKKVAKLISEKLSPDFNIIINQGEKADQIIPHLHVHIVPRYGEEEIYRWKPFVLTSDKAEEVLKKLGVKSDE